MAILPPSPVREKTLKRMRSGFQFWLFQWLRLPAAAWSGVRLNEVDYERAVASVPFKYASKNPFRSTYFACLAMAAEMSTGILALLATTGNDRSVAMLVTGLESKFVKKATGRTYFTCENGNDFFEAIAKTLKDGEPVTVKAETVGRNEDGDEVARFWITWSFKRR